MCTRTSANPNDIREGYCGNCHDWTGGAGSLATILTDMMAHLLPGGVSREDANVLLVEVEGVEYRVTIDRVRDGAVTRVATAREKAVARLREYLHLSSESAEETRKRVAEYLDAAGL